MLFARRGTFVIVGTSVGRGALEAEAAGCHATGTGGLPLSMACGLAQVISTFEIRPSASSNR
ncbi:MAG: hypothetical protein RID23_19305 [Roseovarius sp.]